MSKWEELNTLAQCRQDGRCQYAIDHGVEGLGACPPGKCQMPEQADDKADTGQLAWTPTTENINALPEPVREYIHNLEVNADPAGTVRDLTIARDTIRALEASNRMLRDDKADAERYQWLVDNAVIETSHFRHDGKDPASTKHPIDNAIDAARSKP